MRLLPLKRVVLPIVLGALGAAALVYGAVWNTAEVVEREETTFTVTVDATGKVVPPDMEPLVGAGPAITPGELPVPGPDGAPPVPGPGPEGVPPGQGFDGMQPGPPGTPGFLPGMAAMFMPPFSKKTFPGEPLERTIPEGEPKLVRDVTVGGLVLSDGVLRRTYMGKPPSLCPT